MSDQALIVGAAESPYSRHPPASTTTESLLADAYLLALSDAGIHRDEVDGLGVASFTLGPDHVVDLAWRLGIRARWLMEDTNGGASGINMLQHAVRAVDAGDAETVVLLAGDHFNRESFRCLTDNYNRATAQYLAPIPTGGPNALFAMLTRLHMDRSGLERADYGQLVIAQRRWAARNPLAVYRQLISIDDYLSAPVVADPLHLLDCVPVVSGADAIVVRRGGEGVRVRALQALHNFDGQEGNGLVTGLAKVRDTLWQEAGVGPDDLDLLSVYDDYPAIALIQLVDLGFASGADVRALINRIGSEELRVNTSGGQLSVGQAGAAGGMHGIVEVVTQLRGRAGARQVPNARLALATGYGMVLYRYGACANAVVLERA
jgi:acetyl-CoA acetyltransferase